MVRCLSLAVLALLAVALPAAAEDQAPPSDDGAALPFGPGVLAPAQDLLGPSLGDVDVSACAAVDPACASMASTAVVTTSCQLVEVDLYHPWRLPMVDPDGCVWGLLRRTLGWPPVETLSALFVSGTDLLPVAPVPTADSDPSPSLRSDSPASDPSAP